MLYHGVQAVRDADIVCRKCTLMPVRVFGILASHVRASHRKVVALFDVTHKALCQWYLRIAPLFDPRRTESHLESTRQSYSTYQSLSRNGLSWVSEPTTHVHEKRVVPRLHRPRGNLAAGFIWLPPTGFWVQYEHQPYSAGWY